MSLREIPDVSLQGNGVTFKYLIFQLHKGAESKTILRGLNYLPYRTQMDEAIIRHTNRELEKRGLFERGGEFSVEGGGTLTLNRYYDTVALYGANSVYGEEENRAASAEKIWQAFPGYEVSQNK